MGLIEDRVAQARAGKNPYVIDKLPSGWLVIGDVQPLPGYCLLLADPVVSSINDLDTQGRTRYSLDVLRIGDALLAALGATRINYETLGNSAPALHTHIVPRYAWEPDDMRGWPPFMCYDWPNAPRIDPATQTQTMENIKTALPSP